MNHRALSPLLRDEFYREQSIDLGAIAAEVNKLHAQALASPLPPTTTRASIYVREILDARFEAAVAAVRKNPSDAKVADLVVAAIQSNWSGIGQHAVDRAGCVLTAMRQELGDAAGRPLSELGQRYAAWLRSRLGELEAARQRATLFGATPPPSELEIMLGTEVAAVGLLVRSVSEDDLGRVADAFGISLGKAAPAVGEEEEPEAA